MIVPMMIWIIVDPKLGIAMLGVGLASIFHYEYKVKEEMRKRNGKDIEKN